MKCLLLDTGFPAERGSSPSIEKGVQSVTKQLISPAAHSLLRFGGGQGASRVTGTATVLLPLFFEDGANSERGAGGTDQGCSPRHTGPVLLALCSPPKYTYKGLLWVCTQPEGRHAACTASGLLQHHRLMHKADHTVLLNLFYFK